MLGEGLNIHEFGCHNVIFLKTYLLGFVMAFEIQSSKEGGEFLLFFCALHC